MNKPTINDVRGEFAVSAHVHADPNDYRGWFPPSAADKRREREEDTCFCGAPAFYEDMCKEHAHEEGQYRKADQEGARV